MRAAPARTAFFEPYAAAAEYSKAGLFQDPAVQTPVFVRFSTVAGGAGSVDTPRDVRGFAVKFYTSEGVWDLVGNNIPVFFIQDAIKFPDLVHAVKMEADKGYPQAASAHDTFWDWIGLMPEASHMVMWQMSDRTIPRSFVTMEGFGIHTFRLIDAAGKNTFVKFHWKPKQGLQSQIWDEAVKTAGADPDFQRRDLFERLDRGDYPEWELGIQAFDEETANGLDFDVARFDQDHSRGDRARHGDRPDGAETAIRTISSPKPSRSPSAPVTSCRASTSRTIRCCRGDCSAILIRS